MSDLERRKRDIGLAIEEYREAIVDWAYDNGTQEAQEGIVKVLRDLRLLYEKDSEGEKAIIEAIDAAERWTP